MSHLDHRTAAQASIKEGDIVEGEIIRIEKYGAFCSLILARPSSIRNPYRPPQGLIHISQLHESRVERVEDVVSLQDHVWVKVLEVEQSGETNSSSGGGPGRLRIKLSMKDAAQDGSRQDLGRQREQGELAKTQLETNLNSMIGMGVARDPMAHLLIKNQQRGPTSSSTMTFRGGYSLVDDDEGEPEQSPPPINVAPSDGRSSNNERSNLSLHSMGRGRGATLPAWMTSQQAAGRQDGPTGIAKAEASDASNGRGDDLSHLKRRKSHKARRKDSNYSPSRKEKSKKKKHHHRHDHSRYDSESDQTSVSNSDGSRREVRRGHGRDLEKRNRNGERKKRVRSLSVESRSCGSRDSRVSKASHGRHPEKERSREKRKRRRSRS